MSYQQVTMYRVICDRCGAGADEDSEFYAWIDAGQAASDAMSYDWLITDDGQWCPRCVVYNEDRDEHVPNPEPVTS